MNQVELPVKASYLTYSNCAGAAGVLANVKRYGTYWFIDHCVEWVLKIDHTAKSYTLSIPYLSPWDLSYTSEEAIRCLFIKRCFHKLVKRLLGSFYYLYFWGADRFYLDNSSMHEMEDGLIAGYDDDCGTYTIVGRKAGVYGRYKVSQDALYRAIYSDYADDKNVIHAFRIIDISESVIDLKMLENNLFAYLYPKIQDENVHTGIEVYNHFPAIFDYGFARQVQVYDVFYAHKAIMLDRIRKIEDHIICGPEWYMRYNRLIEKLQMVGDKDFLSRRNQQLLMEFQAEEFAILTNLLNGIRHHD